MVHQIDNDSLDHCPKDNEGAKKCTWCTGQTQMLQFEKEYHASTNVRLLQVNEADEHLCSPGANQSLILAYLFAYIFKQTSEFVRVLSEIPLLLIKWKLFYWYWNANESSKMENDQIFIIELGVVLKQTPTIPIWTQIICNDSVRTNSTLPCHINHRLR